MVKKVVVTLEFECLSETSEQEVKYTLMDALAEFQSARHHNGESYVNKRYPDESVYRGERRVAKIRQVNRRILLAEQMRNSIKTVEVDEC
jgi:hypothetical protein